MTEPKGSENWPLLDKSCGIHDRPPKGEPGHVPCYWTNHGKDDPAGSAPVVGSTKSYREGYANIKWD